MTILISLLAVEETKPKKVAPPAVDVPVDVSRLDMRVGLIVDVKKHPDADALYIEEVDVGEEKTRTIISGLVKHVTLDEVRHMPQTPSFLYFTMFWAMF